MFSKTTPWLIAVIAALIATIVIMASVSPPVTTNTTATEVDTLIVTNTVHTQVVKTKVVTMYDTLYVDSRPYIIARYHDRVDTTNVSVELDITYSEYDKLFDVNADIYADIDTVYITKTITNNITTEKPYKTFALTSGMSPMFEQKDSKIAIKNIGLDLGVRIKGKYDISVIGTTDETFGVRLGVAF